MNGVMRWIGLWTVLLVATGRVASAADEPPLLTIDPGGHTDSLTALIATGPEELITASFDKTIRVWDLSTGETRKIIARVRVDGESEGGVEVARVRADYHDLIEGRMSASSARATANPAGWRRGACATDDVNAGRTTCAPSPAVRATNPGPFPSGQTTAAGPPDLP